MPIPDPTVFAASNTIGSSNPSIIGSAGMPLTLPVGIKPSNGQANVSKKKKHEIEEMMKNIKDKPDYQIDYFQQRQKVKTKFEKPKGITRKAANKVWKDPTLEEWDPEDFRIFVGNIGYEIVDEHLAKAFSKYPSFQKAKVIRGRKNFRSKGYGFVSFKDPDDFLKALKEMDGIF